MKRSPSHLLFVQPLKVITHRMVSAKLVVCFLNRIIPRAHFIYTCGGWMANESNKHGQKHNLIASTVTFRLIYLCGFNKSNSLGRLQFQEQKVHSAWWFILFNVENWWLNWSVKKKQKKKQEWLAFTKILC